MSAVVRLAGLEPALSGFARRRPDPFGPQALVWGDRGDSNPYPPGHSRMLWPTELRPLGGPTGNRTLASAVRTRCDPSFHHRPNWRRIGELDPCRQVDNLLCSRYTNASQMRASGGTRTHDTPVKNRKLFRLSYRGQQKNPLAGLPGQGVLSFRSFGRASNHRRTSLRHAIDTIGVLMDCVGSMPCEKHGPFLLSTTPLVFLTLAGEEVRERDHPAVWKLRVGVKGRSSASALHSNELRQNLAR